MPITHRQPAIAVLAVIGLALAGCEQLGIEAPGVAKEAEGRAIGSACRHSGRALEDCYLLNKKASKAAIFSGWRDMDAYMRENSIEIVMPVSPKLPQPARQSLAQDEAPPGEDAKAEGGATAEAEKGGSAGAQEAPAGKAEAKKSASAGGIIAEPRSRAGWKTI